MLEMPLVLMMKVLLVKQVPHMSDKPTFAHVGLTTMVKLLQPLMPDPFLMRLEPEMTTAEPLQVFLMENVALVSIKTFAFPLRH